MNNMKSNFSCFSARLSWIVGLLICLMACALAGGPPVEAAGGDRITVEGEGESAVANEESSGAREDALESGLEAAFEKALLGAIPDEVPLARREELAEKLGAQKRKFLLKYRILSELPAPDVYFVTVEATYSLSLIRKALREEGVSLEGANVPEVTEIDLFVAGVSSFAWYRALMDGLEGLSRAKRVSLVEVSGDKAVFRVAYRGEVAELADRVSSLQGLPFRIEWDEISEERLSISLTNP